MRVGLTYDYKEDYGIDPNSLIFADFNHPIEISYIEKAITRNGFDFVPIGNMHKLMDRIRHDSLDCDIVFVCDEGLSSRNREAIVPALLELNHIPYIGSDAYCMGLSQNKYHTKILAERLGILCPKGIYLEYDPETPPDIKALGARLRETGLDYPLLVKPNEEGYSMGVFVVQNEAELRDAIDHDFDNYHEPVLIEEYIEGRELFVPIVGTGRDAYALPAGMVVSEFGEDIPIYSVEDKCFDYSHDEVADISDEIQERISSDSLLLYRHMGCRDLGRCDFRLRKNGEPVFLEITPRPGLCENGPFETAANAVGKTYDDVLKEVIVNAAKRYGIA